MTDTIETITKPTAEMTPRELAEACFEFDLRLDGAFPVVMLGAWGGEFQSDDVERVQYIWPAIRDMAKATPTVYPGDWNCNASEDADHEGPPCTADERLDHRPKYGCGFARLERETTDEEADAFAEAYRTLVWKAGGDPGGEQPEGTSDDDDDEEDDRWAKELARESLQQTLAGGHGWVIEVSTPLRKIDKRGLRGFTWAITTGAWFWGATFHEALDKAFHWDALQWEPYEEA